jgi:hypothetical protein
MNALQQTILLGLRRQALAEIRVSHGFRGRMAFRTFRGSTRSDVHLTNCCMNHRLIRAIQNHFEKDPRP